MTDMHPWDELIDDLRQALANLYDPLWPVAESLTVNLGLAQNDSARLKALLLEAITSMAPTANVPRDTRAWRLYELLRLRYVEHLTQEETAHRLAITVRHLGREQITAIEMLAQTLCVFAPERAAAPGQLPPAQEGDAGQTLGTQVEAEITALEAHSRRKTAPVAPAMQHVIDLLSGWCAQRHVTVSLAPGADDAAVAVHPSVLYQILVAVVSYLVRTLNEGAIHLTIADEPGTVLIHAAVEGATVALPPAGWVAAELIESQGGTLRLQAAPQGAALEISLPSASSKVVLVIDDNKDLAHFYRLCLNGSPYRMVHLAEGRRVFESIAAHEPEAIVLDLMLPDVDGWELLAQLHEHPASRGIPIIVCSVVREEELALALGAAACVNKPVRRHQLLAALDAATSRAAS